MVSARAVRSRARGRGMLLLAASLVALTVAIPAYAQETSIADRVRARQDSDARMLVNAREMVYDSRSETVSAVGDVKLYYGGAVLEAERVSYDQRSARVRAFGNVVLTEPDGNVLRGESVELTDDLREGFVQSLSVNTVERTRFAAESGRRTDGNTTVLERGVYTACEACTEDPSRPPLWQVRAARIIHDEGERTVYYEDARLEFFGQPIAWLPFFSHPDPTVRRKTGFLAPVFTGSSELGVGAGVPFFWAIAPNMDLTVTPTIYSSQGFLGQAEFRHRLGNGTYTLSGAGIFQQDPSAFDDDPGPGDMEERWSLRTTGDFDINSRWKFGWDINVLSDRWFLEDYDLPGSGWSEAVSTVFLTGEGNRSWFELRGYHFYGLSQDDIQSELPVAAPVLDYNYVLDQPVLGGEVTFNMNFTALHRDETDLEPLTADNASRFPGGPLTDFSRSDRNFSCNTFGTDCIVPGLGGTYTRASVDGQWRRQLIDPIGQVWTPFAFARGDAIWLDPDDNSVNSAFIDTGDDSFFRGMAGAGLEYRFPFVAQNRLGSHLIEPIAQVILRPDEQRIGELPNEDAQSLFFDGTTLFAWDKFSGYDRIEGGSRANIGAQYTLTMPSGSFLSVLIGQSYHLFGENSFAAGERDLTNTGLDSGLESDRSDYVSSVYLQATQQLAFATRFRFDEDDFSPNVVELESRFNKAGFSGSVIYGRYEDQPRLGFADVREGVLADAKLQVTDTVYLAGGIRYNIDEDRFDETQIGIGYLDECFALGITYAADFSDNGNDDTVHRVLLRLALRTVGEAGTSTSVSSDSRDN